MLFSSVEVSPSSRVPVSPVQWSAARGDITEEENSWIIAPHSEIEERDDKGLASRLWGLEVVSRIARQLQDPVCPNNVS